jgi:ribosomal-protein-alanine N-acetyltransferase
MASDPARVPGRSAAVIAGERVFLRSPVPSDQAEFRALVITSRDFLSEWEPYVPPDRDVDGNLRFRRTLEADAVPRNHKYLVCRLEDGALLGTMNINNIVRGVFRSASLGYWIGAPHARQGYMTEALRLVLRHSFRKVRLHRLEANIRPENVASIALVRRVGFRLEGLSKRYLKIAGRWRDHERWALLAEEWRALGDGRVV